MTKRARQIAGAVFLLGLVAFAFKGWVYPTKAGVECRGENGAIHCLITHQQGSDTVNFCFDAVIECRKSSSVAVAHACAKVEPSGTALKVLQDSDFTRPKDCEAAGFQVANIRIDKAD